MHCGGSTTRSDERGAGPSLAESVTGSAYEPIGKTDRGSASTQSTLPPEDVIQPIEKRHKALFELPKLSGEGRELEEAEEPKSIGRTLVQGLGGFIWIIVLIGFTLARNCGGE